LTNSVFYPSTAIAKTIGRSGTVREPSTRVSFIGCKNVFCEWKILSLLFVPGLILLKLLQELCHDNVILMFIYL